MSKTLGKKAAKIDALKAIEKASELSRVTITEREILQAKIQESNLARESEGKDALSELRRLSEKGSKLPRGAEIVIARHLHLEWQITKRYLRKSDISLTKFCMRARIASSKEAHYLTLPPGESPAKRRPRRSASKYFWFIKAISEFPRQSESILADRVLRGTSLHPAEQLPSLSEAEKIAIALQGIVDKIDEEFGIHAKFMEIAELKATHIAKGGTENWPLYPLGLGSESAEEFGRAVADATDKRFAFWERPSQFDLEIEALGYNPYWYPRGHGSGVQPNTEFFYIPHVPLGVIEFANLANRQSDRVAYEKSLRATLDFWRQTDKVTGKSRISHEYSVRDDWDSVSERPVGQTQSGPEFKVQDWYGDYFAWLIMYPIPDSSRLMPMLYISFEDGLPYIIPLDTRNLEIFRDAIWLDETQHKSMFDRIKELLGYLPGTPKAIEDGFRRTAPWLDHNPFFKQRRQHANDMKLLDAFCHQLWEEKKTC